jgi:hypothetical protein
LLPSKIFLAELLWLQLVRLVDWWASVKVCRYDQQQSNIGFTLHFYTAITSKVKMHLCLEIAASVPYQRPEYSGRVTTQNRQ